MPLFIRLTQLNGDPIYVNASRINEICYTYDNDCTGIGYDNDETLVKESPLEIMREIDHEKRRSRRLMEVRS